MANEANEHFAGGAGHAELASGGDALAASARKAAAAQALMGACAKADRSSAAAAISAGADPSEGLLANGEHGAEMAAWLLSVGANPNGPAEGFGGPMRAAALRGDIELIRLLAKAGASLAAASDDERGQAAAPLREAIRVGNAACVAALIELGADLDALDNGGWTAAMSAASRGEAACLAVLIDAGADMGLSNRHGHTAMALASGNGELDCLREMLRRGQNPNGPSGTAFKSSPVAMAAQGGHAECLGLLLQAGAEIGEANGLGGANDSMVVGDCRAMLSAAREARELRNSIEPAGASSRARL